MTATGLTDMPMYFGWYLLQQMTLAAMYSWWLMPLVSKGVRFEISSAPAALRSISASALVNSGHPSIYGARVGPDYLKRDTEDTALVVGSG